VTGILVIAAYLVFAGSVAGLAYGGPQVTPVVIMAGLAVIVMFAAPLVLSAGRARPRPARQSLLACWPVNRLWAAGLAASLAVAAVDAALGNRVVLIGLLIVGPCCVLLTGRWVPTGLTGLWAISLAALLGVPDGIWGTAVFFIWLGAVAAVALASTAAAAVLQALGPARLR
jgi:hypothetical protein